MILHGYFGVGKSVPQAVLDEIPAIDEAAMGEWAGIIEYVHGEHLI